MKKPITLNTGKELRKMDLCRYWTYSVLNSTYLYYGIYGENPDTYSTTDDYNLNELVSIVIKEYNLLEKDYVQTHKAVGKDKLDVLLFIAKLPFNTLLVVNDATDEFVKISISFLKQNGNEFKTELLKKIESCRKLKEKNKLFMLGLHYNSFKIKPIFIYI